MQIDNLIILKKIIKDDIYKELQPKSDIFLFTGVDNQDDLLKLFQHITTLTPQNMDGYYTSVIIANESNRESQFDQLVAQKTIHWLNI